MNILKVAVTMLYFVVKPVLFHNYITPHDNKNVIKSNVNT